MQKTTSQQLIDSLGYEGGRVGKPLVLGAAIDQTNQSVAPTAGDLLTVPDGSILAITHLVLQIDQSSHIGVRVSSPTADESFNGVSLKDPGGVIRGSMVFRGFSRYRSIFTGATPDFRASQPGRVITWRPKYPIIVPSGWTVDLPLATVAWGHSSAVYGSMMSEAAARQLGYAVEPTGSPTTDRRAGIASTSGALSATDVVAARTGKSIRVLDVHIMSQPEVAAASSLTLQQTDGTKIYKIVNDNPSEFVEQTLSPGWFLKAGQALQVISDVVDVTSINVIYEYVDEDDVPGDSWFSVVEPEFPTPGTSTIGTLSSLTATSTEATLYYAKPDAAGVHTRTSPNKGFQHMLNGYSFFCQKNATAQAATDDTEATRFAISTGSTGGSVGFALATISQTNLQLSPVFSASGHDQCTWGCVEGVNIPGDKDDGSLWVDAIGFNGLTTTPTEATNDLSAWAVNMWGRTASASFSPRTNRGT